MDAFNFFYVVVPEPGNQGEDLNWIQWFIFAHADQTELSAEKITALSKEFHALPIVDEGHDDWQDLSRDDLHDLFVEFAENKGYTVFRAEGLRWAVG